MEGALTTNRTPIALGILPYRSEIKIQISIDSVDVGTTSEDTKHTMLGP
jgi:hypothetical protein